MSHAQISFLDALSVLLLSVLYATQITSFWQVELAFAFSDSSSILCVLKLKVVPMRLKIQMGTTFVQAVILLFLKSMENVCV